MPQSFACPTCGAGLTYAGAEPVIRCDYCGGSVVVPEELRQRPAGQPDPQIPDPSLTEVATLLRAGKRVQATIRYREITGAGLKDAQQAVDAFLAGQPLRRPNRM